MIRKWPAYRFISPMEATRQFHDAYVEGYKRYIRKNIDLEIADKSPVGAKLKFDLQNAHLTQVWTARQIADDLGMPYEAYMHFVFEFASRVKRKHIPQPNQLGPSATSSVAWYAKLTQYWTPDEVMTWLTRMEPLVQYSLPHDKQLPAQEQFRTDLLDTAIAVGRNPVGFVQNRVVALNQLNRSDCMVLGEAAVDAALRDAPRDVALGLLAIHEYEPPQTADFMQSCFGVPGIATSASSVCQRCPHLDTCNRTRDHITRRTEGATGSSDPVLEERRRRGRERIARHRRKTKASSPGASPALSAEGSSLAGAETLGAGEV